MKKALLIAALLATLPFGAARAEDQETILIKYNGGVITDVWKLHNTHVEPSVHGWVCFRDQNGNYVRVVGDVKVIDLKNQKDADAYSEYHTETAARVYTRPQ